MHEESNQVLGAIADVVPEPKEIPGQTKVLFPSALELNESQEIRLIAHAMKRLETLVDELGREDVEGDQWWTVENELIRQTRSRSFLGRRQLFEMIYHNRYEWREHLLQGIFRKSNLVVPIIRKVARAMVARANNYLFGTDPFFAAKPVGPSDTEKAKLAEHYASHKFQETRFKNQLQRAVENGFVRGETILKRHHDVKEDIYQSDEEVLLGDDGEPLMGADGDYITRADQFTGIVDEMTGEEMGGQVLARDGVTPMPMDMIFQRQRITRKLTHYKGPRSECVYFKDFLCPLAADNIEDADCIVHLYDRAASEIADEYTKSGILDTARPGDATVQRTVDMIRKMSGDSPQPKVTANTQRPELNEGGHLDRDMLRDAGTPIVEIAEFWLRYDANEDGILESIVLVMDRKNEMPIYYDHVANVTADGKRPFTCITPNKVDGRWYGIGAIEMFESYQNTGDLLINRVNVTHGSSGRVDFWRPYNTLEGQKNPHLRLNWGSTYTPLPGKTIEECLQSVYLEDNHSDKLMELLEFFLQLCTTESGVSNANDAQMAGLDTSDLATGIRNIEKSGNELFTLFLSHLEPGAQEAIEGMIHLLFHHLDEAEAFSYFELDQTGQDIQIQAIIDPNDVVNLDLDVEVLLTRMREEQVLQSGMQAVGLICGQTPFIALPVPLQPLLAPMYKDMLKALQITHGDKIMDALVQMGPVLQAQQMAQAAAMGEGGEPAPPATNL